MTKIQIPLEPRYGRLSIIGVPFPKGKYGHKYILTKCDCGTEKEVCVSSLKSGISKSCGCLRKELIVTNKTTHGLTPKGEKRHPIYNAYLNLKKRCYDNRTHNYHRYGGRGIAVCNEWLSDPKCFSDWSMANGWQPGLVIDRMNNDGNYEPSNCRWISPKENSRNRSNAKMNKTKVSVARILHEQDKISNKELADIFHICPTLMNQILLYKIWN